jgi:hypothetical protein
MEFCNPLALNTLGKVFTSNTGTYKYLTPYSINTVGRVFESLDFTYKLCVFTGGTYVLPVLVGLLLMPPSCTKPELRISPTITCGIFTKLLISSKLLRVLPVNSLLRIPPRSICSLKISPSATGFIEKCP